ncbi:MAG: nucleoside 2-deoxyribosyltransferase [Bacteroidales bacterium]|nr:nucleoside 2-deoxyribosyltransferase [Bacteroidales bacterium]
MNDIKNMKVYFASPWFNPDQAERENRVKNKLRELGFNVWSPKDNCVCSPIADEEMRKNVFSDNVYNIETSDIIFAITDGKDMGTIWEAGFACGINYMLIPNSHPIKVIYYCETLGPNGQFNLMLAQSGDIVVTKFEDLDKLPDLIREGEGLAYAGIVE